MKIATFTLTRDRLDLTTHCFKTLKDKAGIEYDHFVWDNGSKDGTQAWLLDNLEQWKYLCTDDNNIGIARAMNALKPYLSDYDYVLKFDNDCEAISEAFLRRLIKAAEELRKNGDGSSHNQEWVLSPRVEGLMKPPRRTETFTISNSDPKNWFNFTIGRTDTMGGICRLVPGKIFQEFVADETLPKAKGVDGQMNKWCWDKGINMGYVEDLVVNHYLGTEEQMRVYPEYFVRKFQEEKAE